MAKNRSSRFCLDDGLFMPRAEAEDTQTQAVQKEGAHVTDTSREARTAPVAKLVLQQARGAGVQGSGQEETQSLTIPDKVIPVADLAGLYSPEENEHRPLGTTQGRKGQMAKRINMAFSDDNHAFITMEAARRSMNKTQFVNWLVSLYRNGTQQ